MYLYTRPTPPESLQNIDMGADGEDLSLNQREELEAWQSTIGDYNECKSHIMDW